jgi:hypothetical protein
LLVCVFCQHSYIVCVFALHCMCKHYTSYFLALVVCFIVICILICIVCISITFHISTHITLHTSHVCFGGLLQHFCFVLCAFHFWFLVV